MGITKEELKELKEIVFDDVPREKRKAINLIFDGRQYSLKLPKKFIEEAGVNMKNDFFEVVLNVPDYSFGQKPKLNINLMRKK